MGTDYDEFRKPCPCGQGTIRIGRSSPDHPWVSAYNVHWDANIECPACQKIYLVEGTDQAMRVVRRADVAAVTARRSAYDAASRQFMASSAVAAIKRDFAAHLDGMPSVTAVHRYLDANGMAGYAIGTFRKNWQGGQDWTTRHVGEWNVAKIAGLLDQNSAPFDLHLAQIEKLKAAVGGAPTVMGRIVERQYSVSRQRCRWFQYRDLPVTVARDTHVADEHVRKTSNPGFPHTAPMRHGLSHRKRRFWRSLPSLGRVMTPNTCFPSFRLRTGPLADYPKCPARLSFDVSVFQLCPLICTFHTVRAFWPMRKLLVLCFGVLKTGKPFDPAIAMLA